MKTNKGFTPELLFSRFILGVAVADKSGIDSATDTGPHTLIVRTETQLVGIRARG